MSRTRICKGRIVKIPVDILQVMGLSEDDLPVDVILYVPEGKKGYLVLKVVGK